MEQENHNGHYGAAVIITDPLRTWFYMQKKCDKYPIPEYRWHFCFFGGAVEEGEDAETALLRELGEELDTFPVKCIANSLQEYRRFDISARNTTYTITIFESVIEIPALEDIADTRKYRVEEGTGELVPVQSTLSIPFIWGLEEVMKFYLENNHKP